MMGSTLDLKRPLGVEASISPTWIRLEGRLAALQNSVLAPDNNQQAIPMGSTCITSTLSQGYPHVVSLVLANKTQPMESTHRLDGWSQVNYILIHQLSVDSVERRTQRSNPK